jgi:chromosome segregation ATPase
LEDLKKAVDLKPETATRKDVRDWMAVLGRLAHFNQEVAQLKARNEQTEHQNRVLRSNIEQLEKQEQELRKTIEGLQALELQMEQRRQQLR